MPALPSRIVDLHTHLFNARCLPLAGIFANALNLDADQCPLARGLAKLVNLLAEPYLTADRYSLGGADTAWYVNQLADLAVAEFERPFLHANNADKARLLASPQAQESEIAICIGELERALNELDAIASGAAGLLAPASRNPLGWVRNVVTRALNKLQQLADTVRDGVGEIEDYVAFTFNMLASEKHMAQTLIKRYGDGLPDLEFVHHMMDMQQAYVGGGTTEKMVAPLYPFYDAQLLRMRDLARQLDGKVCGFAAFDPRRPNWREIMDSAIAKGFSGVKFYTAMGYLPIGNTSPEIEKRVLGFFRLCIEKDLPVFTHCTPVGFETRHHKGLNADPRNWEKLLQANDGEFAKLRLCFGHAGGGNVTHLGHHSAGWTANPAEWENRDNYAYKVARLCAAYPNVYCEFAYITELFEGTPQAQQQARERFVANLIGVVNASKNGKYELSTKIAYGSDWNMPSMTKHPREYLNVFLELFGTGELAAYREEFFWKNAYRFLKR
ncbi:MAG: amidohydrolase family protein [Massilia sp.]